MSIIQIIPRQISIYVSDESDPSRTLTSCQVFVDGSKGHMYSIIGEDFLKNMDAMIKEVKKYGIKSMEGPMVLPVALACKRKLQKKYSIILEEKPEDFGNGMDMYRFKVEF